MTREEFNKRLSEVKSLREFTVYDVIMSEDFFAALGSRLEQQKALRQRGKLHQRIQLDKIRMDCNFFHFTYLPLNTFQGYFNSFARDRAEKTWLNLVSRA